MHTDLIPASPLTAVVAPAVEAAKEYIAHSKAENTLKAYRSDWQHFETWCRSRALPSGNTTHSDCPRHRTTICY